MPAIRSIHMVSLAMVLIGCGHAPDGRSARISAPVPGPATAVSAPADEAVPVREERGAQQIDFAEDDLGAGPATQVRGAPKRPPMPRFKLFGTREGDGP